MNILVFIQAPDLGGSEFYLANLVKEWARAGDCIRVFTNHDEYKDILKKNGAAVHHLPFILDIVGNKRGFIKTLALLPFALIWYGAKLLKLRSQTDIILLSGYTEKLLVTALAAFIDLPVVWLEYPPVEKLLRRNFGFPRFLYRSLSRVTKLVIAISQNTLDSLICETQIDEGKVKLIYPGVPVPSRMANFTAKIKARKLKLKLGIRGKTIIGNLSRLAPEKGQENLIKAFPKIKAEFPDACLVLVGRGPDLSRLKLLAAKTGLTADVHFLGFVRDKLAVLQSFDVFVFPAAWELEGFGLVLPEAMLAGVPVVAFRHPPTTEIITHNESGILVKPNNPGELAKALIKILGDNRLAKQLADKASLIAKKSYNIKSAAAKVRAELIKFR